MQDFTKPSVQLDDTNHGALPPTSSETVQPAFLGQSYRFKFHGKALEYFDIWIVNILLTIATLSLYAPWAKVRRLRYFYNNTEFFDRFFDFTGIPTKILIGRLIALGIWGIFALASYMELAVAAFGGLFIYLALPWLLRATIRFTSRNSKFANSRFYFEGTNKTAYIEFFKGLGIVLFSLGIFAPVVIWLYKRYVINHLYAGQLKFSLNNSWSDYMSAVYIPIMLFVAVLFGCGVLLAVVGFNGFSFATNYMMVMIFAAYIIGIFFIGPLIQARIFITTWNNTRLSISQFHTDCNQWKYAWIVLSNWIVKILSLGLMSAWAAIRLTKYQVESLSLVLNDDPNAMMNLVQRDHNAIAEEISDIFDLDISL